MIPQLRHMFNCSSRDRNFQFFCFHCFHFFPFVPFLFWKRRLIMQTTPCYSQILSLLSDYANITLNKILHPTRFYTTHGLEASKRTRYSQQMDFESHKLSEIYSEYLKLSFDIYSWSYIRCEVGLIFFNLLFLI